MTKKHHSLWNRAKSKKSKSPRHNSYDSLSESFDNSSHEQTVIRCDVAVIGGGITALTAALSLKKVGKSVVILEMHEIGSGNSGLTTAHLTSVLDSRYHQIKKNFGHEKCARVRASSDEAIDQIESLVKEFSIPCGFSRIDGFLYANSFKQRSELKSELKAMQEAGLQAE